MAINPSFWRSNGKTDGEFLTVTNKAFHTDLPSAASAQTWLTSMGYLTNYSQENSSKYRTFAFNSGSTILGTTQVGYIAVSTGFTNYYTNNVSWWMGPDEDSGYIITVPWDDVNKIIVPYNSSTEGKYILSPQYNLATSPYLSSDYGSTFQAISGGTLLINGRGSAMSTDGKYMMVTSNLSSDLDYKSSNYGLSWSGFTAAPSLTPFACAISDTGQYQTIADHNGYLFVSNDYAESWNQTSSVLNWICVAINGTGQYQTAGVSPGGQLYRSDNYGVSFTAIGSSLNWTGVVISQSGQYQTASLNSNQIFISSNYGFSWSGVTCNGNKLGVGMSQSGQYQLTGHYNNGYLIRSADYGQTWTELTSQTTGLWNGFSISGTGKFQVACTDTYIYKSDDYGVTWAQSSAPLATGGWNSITINKT